MMKNLTESLGPIIDNFGGKPCDEMHFCTYGYGRENIGLCKKVHKSKQFTCFDLRTEKMSFQDIALVSIHGIFKPVVIEGRLWYNVWENKVFCPYGEEYNLFWIDDVKAKKIAPLEMIEVDGKEYYFNGLIFQLNPLRGEEVSVSGDFSNYYRSLYPLDDVHLGGNDFCSIPSKGIDIAYREYIWTEDVYGDTQNWWVVVPIVPLETVFLVEGRKDDLFKPLEDGAIINYGGKKLTVRQIDLQSTSKWPEMEIGIESE